MTEPTLVYPVIITESNDDGHYFTVTCPNISGMVTQGDTLVEAKKAALDAIATMIDGTDYPQPQDPTNWRLEANECVVYITVDMAQWYREKQDWLTGQPIH
ncbi:type II toxin-antitoxin system HicB family antitoxin [Lacticaseibacillus porcinae]|uniref:type II toxin-antitoxin system HicB family antitoxin n=1 Tax=Lacticaseibacillus porcinae TaxID=1123687 RepID=UPI000F79E981|nr:type II toxin-antitoxin system HicB family antitoxin [Lacticaseibacillus porcinae]